MRESRRAGMWMASQSRGPAGAREGL